MARTAYKDAQPSQRAIAFLSLGLLIESTTQAFLLHEFRDS